MCRCDGLWTNVLMVLSEMRDDGKGFDNVP